MVDDAKSDALPVLRRAVLAVSKELDKERSEIAEQSFLDLIKSMNRDQHPAQLRQQHSSNRYVHGLLASPWHDPARFPGVKSLEDKFSDLDFEVRSFLADPDSSMFLRPATRVTSGSSEHIPGAHLYEKLVHNGSWDEARVYRYGMWNEPLCNKFLTKTCKFIQKALPEVWTNAFSDISISRMAPHTESIKLQGDSNMRLTLELALSAPEGAGMKVGDEVRDPAWHEGKVTVFDDSFEYEVWNRNASQERVVLWLQLWHPEFSNSERAQELVRISHRDFSKRDAKEEIRKLAQRMTTASEWERYQKHLVQFQAPKTRKAEGEL